MSELSFKKLDVQLGRYADQLRGEVKLALSEAGKVATLIAAEVRFLDAGAKTQIINASPVPLKDRLDELAAFQAWTDQALVAKSNPAIARAQVLNQNYVCFVYLPEACFNALRRTAKPGSVTRLCCKYLTDNPVRAFRNAIAHANWTYSPDFDSLVY